MPNTTTRLGLTEPLGTDAVSELRVGMTNNATILDAAVVESSGTFVSRPTAGTIGRFYYATDTGQWFLDSGSAWAPLGAPLTNRVQVGAGSSVSMVAGTLYESLGGTATFSLPAVSMGALVGVTEGGGSGALTVQTSDSTIIHGPGLASTATSFQLNMIYATVLLFSDGSQWFIVAGQQDTGWQPLTLASGMVAGAGTPECRLVGDRVVFRGAISNGTTVVAAGSAIATVPSGLRPPYNTDQAFVTNGGISGGYPYLGINTAGAVTYYNPSGSSWGTGFQVDLSQVAYPIS